MLSVSRNRAERNASAAGTLAAGIRLMADAPAGAAIGANSPSFRLA